MRSAVLRSLSASLALSGAVWLASFWLPSPIAAQTGTGDARSFEPIASVLLHPRCANCHPRDDQPRMGDLGRVHRMNITRGPDNLGAPAVRCFACHQEHNSADSIVPGAPHWALAPRAMGWVGLSHAALCTTLKNRATNGNRSIADLIEHIDKDELVAWGWHPGNGRELVPIAHDEFVSLLKAWRAAGAPCPVG